MSLCAVPITLADAQAFVGKLHRHHKAPVGHRFSIGCQVVDFETSYARQETHYKLVGVVVVGRPVARKTDQYRIAEVTRLCTDGTKNACSFLYSLAARIAKEMGFDRIQTFILPTESGISLRAAGWTFDGTTHTGTWQTRTNRRTDQPTEQKQRWIKTLK